jgi:hypothetical protein
MGCGVVLITYRPFRARIFPFSDMHSTLSRIMEMLRHTKIAMIFIAPLKKILFWQVYELSVMLTCIIYVSICYINKSFVTCFISCTLTLFI